MRLSHAIFFAILSAILFGSKAIVAKFAYPLGYTPESLQFVRMLVALPFFMFFTWKAYRNSKDIRIHIKDHLYLISLGMLGYICASLFDFHGLKYISVSLERVILFSYPSITILIGLLLGQHVSKNTIIAMLLCYLGIFMSCVGEGFAAESIFGMLLIFASGFSYAIFLVGMREMMKRIPSGIALHEAMVWACFCMIAYGAFAGFFSGQHIPPMNNLLSPGLLIALGIGFFCTVLPIVLMRLPLQVLGAQRIAVVGSCGPVAAMFLAALLLGEVMSFLQLGGAILTILAISLLSKDKENQAEPTEDQARQEQPSGRLVSPK